MQTNQTMAVTIGHNVFNIDHKTMMGNLNQFWDCGNAYRIEKGLPAKHLENWLRSPETAEYVAVLEREFKYADSTYYKNPLESDSSKSVDSTDYKNPLESDSSKSAVTADYKNDGSGEILNLPSRHIKAGGRLAESITKTSPLFKTKRGKGGGTWAHLYILLDAATFLDPDFKYQVYKTFVEGKILQYRDESGDRYKPFNMAIDQLPDRVGKDNKWLYVHAANLLAERIGLPAVSEMPVDDKGKHLNRWNAATAHQLSARADAEKMLTGMVQFGLVRDWEHLKDLVERV